ncbi:MAG TPA: glutamate-1-semialdehyde 2,1-aminomutase [Candidatus Polarisedimenticolia bacterium]|jgi:glutamate-1-semialdehyde 2,1-aminomutase|nr:glutamate-1-semialdehyde 2,1-aminomutase [Candidatus Polarisedimenticolia bacterium]
MGDNSTRLFEKARQVIPGGVNSPVRAFRAVGGTPIFFQRGRGAMLFDVDGRGYIDYVCSWGPLILGHAEPGLVRAVMEAASDGTSFGAPNPHEVMLARLVVERVPGVEKVRLVNSGTEATLSALRLARAFTGRECIVKMEGCYHGHVDSLLVKAGSGVATLGIPGTPGVPARVAEQTLVVPYNDLDAIERLVRERGGDIACVIVEPVAANMGVVPPRPGYLEGLREITAKAGILLVFDEVITGFRLAPGGAQERYRIAPDLTTLGKILGGGLPIGAYGGREEIMDRIAPEGDVYQAGTLSGNPVATRAGIAMLEALAIPGLYERIEELSARLETGLAAAIEETGADARVTRVSSLLTLFFGVADEPVNWSSVADADTKRYGLFFHKMLEAGVYLPPSQYEAWFVSLAHNEEVIDATIEAARQSLKALQRAPLA